MKKNLPRKFVHTRPELYLICDEVRPCREHTFKASKSYLKCRRVLYARMATKICVAYFSCLTNRYLAYAVCETIFVIVGHYIWYYDKTFKVIRNAIFFSN